jgi:hypothetical protein
LGAPAFLNKNDLATILKYLKNHKEIWLSQALLLAVHKR